MANIKSAKKRTLVIEKKTAVNKRIKEHLKQELKNFDKLVEAKDFAKADEQFKVVEKKLMQAASKNILSKNAASRKVSRLAKRLNEAKASK